MSQAFLHDGLSKLIVNYLPKTFSEQDFFNLFSVFGSIHSCKLMVDLKTGVSKGWGFVNYYSHEDATNAIKSYNGLKMQNKTIRVSFADGEADSKGQVFVSGLKKNMTQTELERMFSEFGKLTWCYIMPKGAGLVRFEKKDDATRAIENLDGKVLLNNPYPLKVSLHQSSRGKARTQPDTLGLLYNYSPKAPSTTKYNFHQRFSPLDVSKPIDGELCTLYVSGLPPDFDEAQMYKMFSPFGAISNAALMVHPDGKMCKGVAFITMVKHEDAVTAIQVLHGIEINNRELRVSFKRKQ